MEAGFFKPWRLGKIALNYAGAGRKKVYFTCKLCPAHEAVITLTVGSSYSPIKPFAENKALLSAQQR